MLPRMPRPLLALCLVACVSARQGEVSELLQAKNLPANVSPLECVLNLPVNDLAEPYMLARYDGVFRDLTAIRMSCLTLGGAEYTIVRECPDNSRLRFAGLNGTFSDPVAGDPAKAPETRYSDFRAHHLRFEGGEGYDPRSPLVQFIFWCAGPNGVIDARDPEWYDPNQTVQASTD